MGLRPTQGDEERWWRTHKNKGSARTVNRAGQVRDSRGPTLLTHVR